MKFLHVPLEGNHLNKEKNMPLKVLDILKKSDTGLTTSSLFKKAHEEGDERPLPELKTLVENGFVRIDTDPSPARVKATPKAFEE